MSGRKLFLLFVLTIALVLPASAQESPPPGGEPKPFALPEATTFELENGLDVTLVPYGTVPKVTAAVVVRAGNVNEEADEVWLADLTADLMKEGTATHSAAEIAEAAARMGGSINVGVGADQTTISGDVLSEFGPDLIRLLADVLRNPAFPESELDRLKRDRLRQLAIIATRPDVVAQARFMEVLYGDHPYGRLLPTEEMLTGYTIDDIKGFYAEHFGASRARVYVVGRFDEAAVERAIREAFAEWQRGTEPEPLVPSPGAERAVYVVDQPGAAQTNLLIGLPVVDPSHPDYVELQVTNALLGGAFGSRITSNIREDKGYTYSPYSSVSSRYRDAYWAEEAAVTTDVTGPAVKEIFYEIDRLQSEPPAEQELEGIQNYLAGTFVLQNSARNSIINQLAFLDLHGLDRDYLTRYVQSVHAVTPADVQRIAREYLEDEEMVIVAVGDRATIEAQLAPYGEIR